MVKTKVRVFHFFILLSSISAWTYFAVLLTAYTLATMSLGSVPSYDAPDPKYFSFYEPIELILNISSNIWGISILFWLTFNIMLILDNLNYIKSNIFLLGTVGQLLAIAIFSSNIMEWWMD